MDLNRVMLLGRLSRDPEVRTTPNGRAVANFSVATGRVWKDEAGAKQERTEFSNCVVWGKLAEIAGQYLSKGRRIFVEGRIETRDWTGQDGVKRYRTEVIVDNFIMLDSNKGGGTSVEMPAESRRQPQAEEATEEIKVEDIPF